MQWIKPEEALPVVPQQDAALPGVRKEEKESCDDDKDDGESAPKVPKREPYRIREAVRCCREFCLPRKAGLSLNGE